VRDGQLWRRERERRVPHAWAQAKARRRSPTARALQAARARALQAYSNGWTVSFHRSEKTSRVTRRPHLHRGACDGQGVPSSRRANAVSSELRPTTPLKAQTYALNVWRPQRVVASDALSHVALQVMPRAGCRAHAGLTMRPHTLGKTVLSVFHSYPFLTPRLSQQPTERAPSTLGTRAILGRAPLVACTYRSAIKG